jgi:hypothetical protein
MVMVMVQGGEHVSRVFGLPTHRNAHTVTFRSMRTRSFLRNCLPYFALKDDVEKCVVAVAAFD